MTYDAVSGTATIGSGLIWDTVYQQLQEYNVTVLGGRVTGVSERRELLGRCSLNPCCATGWRRRLAARRRLVPGDPAAVCTLTDHG